MPYRSWRLPSVACEAGGVPVPCPPPDDVVVPVPPVLAELADAANSSESNAIAAVAANCRTRAITIGLRPRARGAATLQGDVHSRCGRSLDADACTKTCPFAPTGLADGLAPDCPALAAEHHGIRP